MKTCTRLAHALSWGLHPFLLPLYLVALLLTATAFAHYPGSLKLYFVWVTTLYALLIPGLSLGVLRRAGRISSYRIDDRHERIWPLAIGTVCYILCALTLGKVPAAGFLRKVMLAAACCEALCLAVSLRWKISLHLTGMGAAVAVLTMMNIIGVEHALAPLACAVVASGALASARLFLGCHNGWQILAGFCGGFAVATLAVLFL